MKKFYDRIECKESGCWLWLGAYSNGYGQIVIDGKIIGAHRFSYKLHCGEIPKGDCVLHKCDNGFCVNPKHLFLGSQQANMTDKVLKGRQAKGIDNGRAKLTEESIIEIRRILVEGNMLQKDIAALYKVDPKTITNIKLNRQWRHINV